MGSSTDTPWIVLAVICGGLYLLFDAARYLAHQVSQVTLRRWSSDPDFHKGSRWFQYDPRNLQLVSGALLQLSLICAFASTVMALPQGGAGVAISVAIWAVVSMIWKFLLALVPDEMAETLLRALLPFTHFFFYLFWPVLYPLRRMIERIEKRHEDEAEDDKDEAATEEEVQAFIDVGEEEGIFESTDAHLIQSVVEFGDRYARELMTPRIDVLAFDANHPMEELARLFSESKYSRIPIYTESIDAITGIVHIKEVFDAMVKGETLLPVHAVARPPYFVSETKKVSELLREFQSEHLQVAVVVDEFGGTAGLITIEDVIEDIVGEISDEHEDAEATVVDLGGDRYLVSGLLRVDELEETLQAELSGDDYETLAGMIVTSLGRIPKVGAQVRKSGWIFEVDRADRRRIYRVKVSRDPEWESQEEES